MTESRRKTAFWIFSLSIAVASIVSIAIGVGELAGFLLSMAILWLWSPMLLMKVAMIRVRARAQAFGRPVSRTDRVIALVGSCIVGPVLGLLIMAILAVFTTNR